MPAIDTDGLVRSRHRRTARALVAGLALACAPWLSGCDGGIFGTGDGSPDVLPTPPAATAPEQPGGGGADGTLEADQLPDADASPDVGDMDAPAVAAPGASPDAGPAPSRPLGNAVDGGAATMPRLRLVNASGVRLALALGIGALEDVGGAGDVVASDIAPGSVHPYLAIPSRVDALILSRADAPGQALLRLEPLALATASVTTLIVRDGDPLAGPAIAVTALATLTTTDDPTQAFARVVRNTPAVDSALPAAPYTMVSTGPDPGGVDAIELPVGDVGGPDGEAGFPAYTRMPAGEYRLEGPDGTALETLVLIGGDVVTFVASDEGALLAIDDDAR